MLAAIFVVVGVILLYGGSVLITNRHGATDWFVDYYVPTMRNRFGRVGAPFDYNREGAQLLGGVVVVLGLVFALAGVSQIAPP